MTSRVPPSNKPPQQTAQAQRLRRSTRPQAASEKPKPIKLGGAQSGDEAMNSPEAQLWAGVDYDKSLEMLAKDVEGRMAEIAVAEEADKEAVNEHHGEQHEQAAKKEGFLKVFSWSKPAQQPAKPQAPLAKTPQQPQQQGTQKLPAFRVPNQSSMGAPQKMQTGGHPSLTGVSSSRLQAVGVVQNKLAGESARNERPPDAFQLLKEAREKGVLFVEDALKDGHREEDEDPEHAAAVEECIRLCFGLRGILRIGPGHNDKLEPIIVVATTHGFSDASLAKVPEKVHRFATLIAIPFELLPLKRER